MAALDKVLKDINEFFDSRTPEELAQFFEVCNRFEDDGPTVEEHFAALERYHAAKATAQDEFSAVIEVIKQKKFDVSIELEMDDYFSSTELGKAA